MRDCIPRRKQVLRVGLLTGLIGGLVATVAMSSFQSAWNATTRRRGPSTENSDSFAERPGTQPTDVEISRLLLNRIANIAEIDLSNAVESKAALALHYGIGAVGGCGYCFMGKVAFPRFQKEHPWLAGAAFGAAFFVTADMVLLPLIGFPNKGSQFPLKTWIYGLSSHIVFGLTASEACNFVSKFL